MTRRTTGWLTLALALLVQLPTHRTVAGAEPPMAPQVRLVYQSGNRQAYLDDADRLYYFDGRRWVCQLPDRTLLIWGGRNWIPAAALNWSELSRSGPVAATPQSRLWVPSRFNIERSEYLQRFGQDNYYLYGPGHFID